MNLVSVYDLSEIINGYNLGDNIPAFMHALRKNITTVTPYVMKNKLGVVDNDLLTANICWMVTDTVTELATLTNDPIKDTSKISDAINALENNKLVIVHQNDATENLDHWFALIGTNDGVYIIEHLENTCLNYELVSDIRYNLEGIKDGTIPDRFYNVAEPHVFSFLIFDRKHLNSHTVEQYIQVNSLL